MVDVPALLWIGTDRLAYLTQAGRCREDHRGGIGRYRRAGQFFEHERDDLLVSVILEVGAGRDKGVDQSGKKRGYLQ